MPSACQKEYFFILLFFFLCAAVAIYEREKSLYEWFFILMLTMLQRGELSEWERKSYVSIIWRQKVKEFHSLPHRQWKKSFVMPNTTTTLWRIRREREENVCEREKMQSESERERRGEPSKEVAEAIWLHPQIFFTLTTIWGERESEKERKKPDSNHDVTMAERGEKRKLI
jgi:hypothetical protein